MPRALDDVVPEPLPLQSRWAVVTGDATQTTAMALARRGASYIIQGPPGTGKSQTITNLIADYRRRSGKRVLFVCEKRAAIDVVFHRLRQQGLDELCCLIHDSQADKKAFVLNLKQTYETWSSTEDGLGELERKRKALVRGIDNDVQALARFDEIMRAAPEHLGTAVRRLIQRIVELHEHEQPLDALQREALPAFAAWQAHADLAHRLETALRETAAVDALARHVFARLSARLIAQDRPLARLSELTDRCEEMLDRCEQHCADAWEGGPTLAWRDVRAMSQQARLLATLARKKHLALLAAGSDASARLDSAAEDLARFTRTQTAAAARTTYWRDKLPVADARLALATARRTERSPLRILMPSWWRLRKLLGSRYDFSRHTLRPAPGTVLADLVAEHEADAALSAARTDLGELYGAVEAEAFIAEVRAAREAALHNPMLAAFHQHLMNAAEARAALEQLAALAVTVAALDPLLEELLDDVGTLTTGQLGEVLRDLRENGDSLTELLPLLRELMEADPTVARTLRTLPLAADSIEYAVAFENLERIYARERWLSRFDAATLVRHARRIARADQELLALNAQTIAHNGAAPLPRERAACATCRVAARCRTARRSRRPTAAGRRELEHEFGKTMRYKSIRELASGDTGQVMRDLKPIWLMSPLSASPTRCRWHRICSTW